MQCDIEPLTVLNGCVICVSGFTQELRVILKGMIEFLGGVYMEDMEFQKVTFLISCNTQSEKTKHAKRWGVPVLTQQWIFDCLSEQRFVSINNYILPYKNSFPMNPRNAFVQQFFLPMNANRFPK